MFSLQTMIVPRGGGLTAVSRAVHVSHGFMEGGASVFTLKQLHPYTAHEVCGWIKGSHLEDQEDPHGHPEPPTDKMLSDFFVAVFPQPHHH